LGESEKQGGRGLKVGRLQVGSWGIERLKVEMFGGKRRFLREKGNAEAQS